MSSVKKAVKKVIPERYLTGLENSYRLNKAKAANLVYGNPAKGMKVAAITGTNGKTTTCAYLNEILKAGGLKTAVYTTAFIEIKGESHPNKTHMTIASPWAVQRFFSRARRAGVDWVVLEVTSHSLDQFRIFGVPIEIAAVTNISQDHLDYHKTMENYASAKARLITDFNPKRVILNADDEWFAYFAKKVKRGLLTVGQSRAGNQIKGLNVSANGTAFTLISAKGVIEAKTKLIGEFNAYNAAFAAVVGQYAGVSKEDIAKGINNLPVVPGRLEPIEAGQAFDIVVDYAHTPDALERVLGALKTVTKGNLRLVFGATGDRDKSKRPIMGEIAAKLADKIYLTDDETYTEDAAIIRLAVKEGIVKAGGIDRTIEIADRREAIVKAFKDASKGDTVLLAGMGHQDYRNMSGKKKAWDERKVAKEIIKTLNN